jgi:GntR family transcriptional repressor for pyruvate dehydrogenase complex
MAVSRPLVRARVADQIIAELRDQVATGELPRGARLPTERELARRFAVSQPTVREAIRALNTIGLVEARHGSGAYVTADAASLLASSLGTVLQLEGVSVQEVLRLLEHLNIYTAQLAVERATEEDITAVRQALDAIAAAKTAAALAEAVTAFPTALIAAAHDRLLAVLAGFLVRLVIELAQGGRGAPSAAFWKRWAAGLQQARGRIVETLERRDCEGLVAAAVDFHRQAAALINSDPSLRHAHFSEPPVAGIIAGMVNGSAQRSARQQPGQRPVRVSARAQATADRGVGRSGPVT